MAPLFRSHHAENFSRHLQSTAFHICPSKKHALPSTTCLVGFASGRDGQGKDCCCSSQSEWRSSLLHFKVETPVELMGDSLESSGPFHCSRPRRRPANPANTRTRRLDEQPAVYNAPGFALESVVTIDRRSGTFFQPCPIACFPCSRILGHGCRIKCRTPGQARRWICTRPLQATPFSRSARAR